MDVVQEVSPAAIEIVVPATQAESVVVLSSTIAAPLLSVVVETIGTPTVLPPSLSASMVLPADVLMAMVLPSSSSCPCVSLDHLYTYYDVESLWSVTYKSEQKTSVGFVSAFDKNLIRSVWVQNATDSARCFSKGVYNSRGEQTVAPRGSAKGCILGGEGCQVQGYCSDSMVSGAP